MSIARELIFNFYVEMYLLLVSILAVFVGEKLPYKVLNKDFMQLITFKQKYSKLIKNLIYPS